MFKSIKEFFFGKPVAPKVEDTKVAEVNAAPYKVEPPVLTEVVAPAKKPAAPKAKAPAAKAAPAKKPAAPKAKAPAKKSLAKAGEKKQPAKKPPAKKTK